MNDQCPLRAGCRRFTQRRQGVGYMTLFRPERRRDGALWCKMRVVDS